MTRVKDSFYLMTFKMALTCGYHAL